MKEVFSVANNDDDEMKHVVVDDDVIVLILFPRLAVTAEANNGIDSPYIASNIAAILYTILKLCSLGCAPLLRELCCGCGCGQH